MTAGSLFCSLDSAAIAAEIRRASQSVCYAAPGVHTEPATALAEVAGRIDPAMITVCLDFDERVLRMGFGDIDAVKVLRDAGITVTTATGLRTGLVVIDRHGYIFTPTALYLEADHRLGDAPNAMRLSDDQVSEALARLSPAAKAIAIALAKTDQQRQAIKERAVEIPSAPVSDSQVSSVQKRLEEAPPAKFDVARQVRVFSAYLQYIDLNLVGAAMQRRRISIPPKISGLGGSEEIERRLRTNFDLIEKGGELSSAQLERKLGEIRKHFTRSLGKDHGRVFLLANKPELERRIEALRGALKAHQQRIEKELGGQLNASRKLIVDYYVDRVTKNPPDSLRGQVVQVTDSVARKWLEHELDRVFPKPEQLIREMTLDVRYKDLTFETLNQKEFLEQVRKEFPEVNWEKAYQEFRAAGEQRR